MNVHSNPLLHVTFRFEEYVVRIHKSAEAVDKYIRNHFHIS